MLNFGTATWTTTMTDTVNGRTWHQIVDLSTGTWDQEYSVGATLVWKDSWNLDGTVYNPADSSNSPITLLATAQVESEEGTDYTTAAIVSASALTLSILACAYIQKRKVEEGSDHFQRLL